MPQYLSTCERARKITTAAESYSMDRVIHDLTMLEDRHGIGIHQQDYTNISLQAPALTVDDSTTAASSSTGRFTTTRRRRSAILADSAPNRSQHSLSASPWGTGIVKHRLAHTARPAHPRSLHLNLQPVRDRQLTSWTGADEVRRPAQFRDKFLLAITGALLAAVLLACSGSSAPTQTSADIDSHVFYGELVDGWISTDHTQNTMTFEVTDQDILGYGLTNGEITLHYSAIHSQGWHPLLVKGNILRVEMKKSNSGNYPSVIVGLEEVR